MSGDLLIDPLSPLISDELTLPLQPDFSGLVNDSLTGVASPDDGFDSVLTDLISIVDSLEGGLATLGGADGGDLDDAFLEISELDIVSPGVDVANLTTALPDVQTNVDNLANLLAGASALPQPPGAPPPPGGAPPGGGCATVDFGTVDEYTAGVFTHREATLQLTNAGGAPYTVTGVSWSPNYPTLVQQTPSVVGAVVQPGASLPVGILFTAAGDGPASSTLTIQTTGADPQPCVLVKWNIVPNPKNPSSGPSGPQPA